MYMNEQAVAVAVLLWGSVGTYFVVMSGARGGGGAAPLSMFEAAHITV